LTSYKKLIQTTPTFIAASTHIGIEDENLRYAPSRARIFADVIDDSILTPTVPPNPDADVYLASSTILSKIFSIQTSSSIRIGHVIGRPDVEVRVDINALTKHLFITGTTGSGKSNTVAILAERIAEIGGTAIVIDVHGEYINLTPSSSEVLVQPIDFMFNPLKIPPKILARMIIPEAGATIQRSLTAKALQIVNAITEALMKVYGVVGDKLGVIPNTDNDVKTLKNEILKYIPEDIRNEAKNYVNTVVDTIVKSENLIEGYKSAVINLILSKGGNEDSGRKAQSKADEFFESIPINFSSPTITELIRPSTIIVINISELPDEQKDYSVKILLDEILNHARSRTIQGSPLPVVVFVEEAHRFISSTRATVSRTSIERVAREGRKFGVSLAIVSQRPRNLDPNIVSQIQNFVLMKLVQEEDQKFVVNVSDALTEDIASSLAALNTGEAILLGEWISRFPVYVKIDKHTGKKLGTTLDIASIWKSLKERSDSLKNLAKSSDDLYKELTGII
ncbi:MAG: ATP-binding protein, partial [Ignisphaera sp.]|nr:ATP-binding protein [Ignisphaera sp.]